MAKGTLRVYLGAAPGVGKTFAMLDEGWRRAHRGTDVVVAFVETHGRPKTEAQIRDLEVVPRRQLTYRGAEFEEMDLEAVLDRAPKVALVDELAHTNVPGSRHEKRWQDVQALLDAGIDVISTVNIQHLEGLNDVVAQISGVVQHETVPDSVVRMADQVELVDMAPEALRRRLAHGNVYAAAKVDAALGNYFRVGNLAALRELALLWVADRVDDELQDYRKRHSISEPWETRERVAVALTGAPAGELLIRRAARIAGRAKADLLGVHVRRDDGLSNERVGDLAQHRQLLEDLGGSFHEVMGQEVAKAVVSFARSQNATQLVLGASRRTRWNELVHGSVISEAIRAAADGGLDVHVITTDAPGSSSAAFRPRRFRLSPLPARRRWAGFALAAVGLPVLTVALTQARSTIEFQGAVLCYLMLVVAVSALGGMLPSIGASLTGFLLLNWYFSEPIHTFTINRSRDVLSLIGFLTIALVVSALVDVAARRHADALRARAEASGLVRMAGAALQSADPLPAILGDLVSLFGLEGVAVLPGGKGEPVAQAGENPPVTAEQANITVPLADPQILAVRGPDLRPEDRNVLRSFATQLALALEGRRLQQQAAAASATAKANELRSGLLAAVGHDLRTPLASIKTGTTSLLSEDIVWDPAAARELLQTIDDEADRLDGLVANLLDISRLQSGAVAVRAIDVGLDEVVQTALHGLPTANRTVTVDLPESLPRVRVDPTLLERATANICQNALVHTPFDSSITITAGEVGDSLHLRIVDNGPGIAPSDRERVFERFQRIGDQPNGEGVGLGLAVAKGFIEAIGGEIWIEDTPGGGCTMVLKLPKATPCR